MFFTATSSDATGPMDWTTKHHRWKSMVKNTMKSRQSGSIVLFVGKYSIW